MADLKQICIDGQCMNIGGGYARNSNGGSTKVVCPL